MMEIHCKRNTGFYGMTSGIYLNKNGKKWLYLQQNQSKTVQVFQQKCEIQAQFFLLKSKPITLVDTGKPVTIELTMNTTFIWIYVVFFSGLLILPLLHVSIIGIIGLFFLYGCFLYSMIKQAYQLKEIE